MTGRYECTPPDFWSFVLSIGARITWVFLFQEPDRFAGFKRPARGYRYVVIGTMVGTLVPNAILHVWALKMALRVADDFYTGVVNAIIAIVLWVMLTGLVVWMALTILLSGDDDDFEPVVRMKRRNNNTTVGIEPYTDDPITPSGRLNRIGESGYLARAYAQQRHGPSTIRGPHSNLLIEGQQSVEPTIENTSASEERNRLSLNRDEAAPLHCQTIARYQYMPQANTGAHSWWSFPLIPLILIPYSTVILTLQLLFIREDRRLARFREPSFTIKKWLYLPLGAYLISLYAIKHRIRASLFESFHTPVPEPWKKLIKVIPGITMFKNLHTGEVTQDDPRQRAMPRGAYANATSIDNNAYIAGFNAAPRLCTVYHGHLGRLHKSTFRIRPTFVRIGYLSLSLYLLVRGCLNNIVFFDFVDPYREILKHPDVTPVELASMRKELVLWQILVYSTFPLLFLAGLHTAMCWFSMVILWCRAILKQADREDRERAAREQGQDNGAREGAIRLE